MIVNNVQDIGYTNIFHDFSDFFHVKSAYIKYEGLNISGSIKLKTASYLISGLEKKYSIHPQKNIIIESSSGNLGIALSIVCKSKGYRFICITDPNTLDYAENLMKVYGTEIIKITKKDQYGGFLNTRVDLIKEMLKNNPNLVWTNQYASSYNLQAHYETTAKEIFEFTPNLDYLFIGSGTTGTLVGCAKFFHEHSPSTKIIAVDSVGSITFGFPASKRCIPGLGTSRKPEILSLENIYDICLIKEKDTIITCNNFLRKYGLFLGGSSGTVICAAKRYISTLKNRNISIMLISPDFGEKYLKTIYNPTWVENQFGTIVRKEAFNE